MDKRYIAIIAVLVVVIAGAVAWFAIPRGNDDVNHNPDGETVTDALGREVVIPSTLENGIVTIGSSGPLRFASMFDVYDDIIEVDKGDITDSRNGRGYSYAFEYFRLDPKTQSHADNALDAKTAESIHEKNPSLVITNEGIWNKDQVNFELLASDCTVVVLKDQQMQYMTDDQWGLADYFEFNVNLLGKVLDKEDRAKEVIAGIEDIIKDLRSYNGASDIRVYVAGVTISGSNPLNATFPKYIPFTLNGITNAYNLGSTANKVELTEEQFTKLGMDMIVIDPSSSDKIKNTSSQYVLRYLYTINNDSDPSNDVPMYITFPIVWDSINYDCALASAYFTSHLVYGKLTLDDVKEKVQHIFDVFYGEENAKHILDDMESFFIAKSSGAGQNMPLFEQVKVVYDEAERMYSIQRA